MQSGAYNWDVRCGLDWYKNLSYLLTIRLGALFPTFIPLWHFHHDVHVHMYQAFLFSISISKSGTSNSTCCTITVMSKVTDSLLTTAPKYFTNFKLSTNLCSTWVGSHSHFTLMLVFLIAQVYASARFVIIRVYILCICCKPGAHDKESYHAFLCKHVHRSTIIANSVLTSTKTLSTLMSLYPPHCEEQRTSRLYHCWLPRYCVRNCR